MTVYIYNKNRNQEFDECICILTNLFSFIYIIYTNNKLNY